MSNDSNDPFKTNGQNTWQGSTNQGAWEAQNNYAPSPQQPGESYTSFLTRMNSYNANKK